ncbi:unnamed protein product [Rhizophagus irregularis]|nr:unnamed protein product [Rhizophagus irregularis]
MKLDFKVSGGLSGSEEWKRTKIRSGWLPSSEERKEPSFVSTSTKLVRPFGFGVSGEASEFQRMKKKPRFVSIYESWFASSEEWKRTKIRSGGLPIFGKSGTKIHRVDFRIPKNRKSRFIRSGRFLNSEERKIKIQSGGFPNSKEWKIKIRSGRFLNSEVRKRTNIRLGRLPSSGERKKIKIRRFGWISDEWMNQNQDSFYIKNSFYWLRVKEERILIDFNRFF